MEAQNSTAKLTTARTFDFIPVADDSLMEVRAGIDVFFAQTKASALESAVLGVIRQGVSNNGMDPDTLALCELALDAASALRAAAGQEA